MVAALPCAREGLGFSVGPAADTGTASLYAPAACRQGLGDVRDFLGCRVATRWSQDGLGCALAGEMLHRTNIGLGYSAARNPRQQ